MIHVYHNNIPHNTKLISVIVDLYYTANAHPNVLQHFHNLYPRESINTTQCTLLCDIIDSSSKQINPFNNISQYKSYKVVCRTYPVKKALKISPLAALMQSTLHTLYYPLCCT